MLEIILSIVTENAFRGKRSRNPALYIYRKDKNSLPAEPSVLKPRLCESGVRLAASLLARTKRFGRSEPASRLFLLIRSISAAFLSGSGKKRSFVLQCLQNELPREQAPVLIYVCTKKCSRRKRSFRLSLRSKLFFSGSCRADNACRAYNAESLREHLCAVVFTA